MSKYRSEMRRTTRKKIQTNLIFLYAGVLAMTTNNKNYIWGHGVLLFLLFIEALYKRWLTRSKCWYIRWLTALRCITRQESAATNTNRLSHRIFPVPISLPLSWLSSANQHHPLLTSLLPCTARNQAETFSPVAEGLLALSISVFVRWEHSDYYLLRLSSIWPDHTIKNISKAQLYELTYKNFKEYTSCVKRCIYKNISNGMGVSYSRSVIFYIYVPFTKSTLDTPILALLLNPSYQQAHHSYPVTNLPTSARW